MIYDCFTFAGEWVQLQLRLSELAPVVDWFVLVEASVTHRGDPKPLHFADGRAKVGLMAERIIYVRVDDMPTSSDHWEREQHQRRAIERGLTAAAADDLVLVSDVDEIPRRDIVRRLADELVEPVSLEQRMYYFSLNLRVPIRWTLAKAARRRDLADANDLRLATGLRSVEGAGWHFSFLGDEAAIKHKLGAFAHAELDQPHYAHPAHIARCQRLAVDLFGRYVLQPERIDDTFPQALMADADSYGSFLRPSRTPLQEVQARTYARLTRYSRFGPKRLLGAHPLLLLVVLSPLMIAGALRDLVHKPNPVDVDLTISPRRPDIAR